MATAAQGVMGPTGRLVRARQDAGLTQDEVAARAHTSRTLSAYEHRHESPTLQTAAHACRIRPRD
jgi:transcriptional regulator with XRE-family HTH domain